MAAEELQREEEEVKEQCEEGDQQREEQAELNLDDPDFDWGALEEDCEVVDKKIISEPLKKNPNSQNATNNTQTSST